MDVISVPFQAEYGSTGFDALGSDKLDIAGGTVLVIGSMPAAVQVRGIVRLTPEAIEIEYRSAQVQVLGLLANHQDTELHSVRIPTSAVDSIDFRTRFFRRPQLVIEFNRLDVVPNLPWSETTRLVLDIERKDRDRARELVVSTRMQLADAQLRRLGE